LCLGGSASTELKEDVKLKQRPELDDENIDLIVQSWLSRNENQPLSEKSCLYLAVIMHHPFGGPVFALISLWVTMRCISMIWLVLSHNIPVISIPLETYVTLIAAAFYYGHFIGKKNPSHDYDLLGIAVDKISRRIPQHIHGKLNSSDEHLVEEDDDHSTLVDEMNLDSDDALILPEVESVAPESSVLPSPLPKYPENAISSWSKPDHNIFMVRSKSYLVDRLKMPSLPAVFECRGVDVWLTDNAGKNPRPSLTDQIMVVITHTPSRHF
jgi:hypothetical protein